VNGLTGKVTIVITLSDATGNGQFRMDNFSLTGYVQQVTTTISEGGNGKGYRYGFNGKENDNEVKGSGNQQDYGMRIYDPRLGRFLSTDPLTKSYPMLTPFQYASNNLVWMIDLDGLEGVKFSDVWNGKAHVAQFINEPDIGGTVMESVESFNRSFNPIFSLNNYGCKLLYGKDFDWNSIDDRHRTGVIADMGVEGMMWLTAGRLFGMMAKTINIPIGSLIKPAGKSIMVKPT